MSAGRALERPSRPPPVHHQDPTLARQLCPPSSTGPWRSTLIHFQQHIRLVTGPDKCVRELCLKPDQSPGIVPQAAALRRCSRRARHWSTVGPSMAAYCLECFSHLPRKHPSLARASRQWCQKTLQRCGTALPSASAVRDQDGLAHSATVANADIGSKTWSTVFIGGEVFCSDPVFAEPR